MLVGFEEVDLLEKSRGGAWPDQTTTEVCVCVGGGGKQ